MYLCLACLGVHALADGVANIRVEVTSDLEATVHHRIDPAVKQQLVDDGEIGGWYDPAWYLQKGNVVDALAKGQSVNFRLRLGGWGISDERALNVFRDMAAHGQNSVSLGMAGNFNQLPPRSRLINSVPMPAAPPAAPVTYLKALAEIMFDEKHHYAGRRNAARYLIALGGKSAPVADYVRENLPKLESVHRIDYRIRKTFFAQVEKDAPPLRLLPR